jgi:hypothetical protein
MKRFTMAALTALMVFALTVPAWALETQFGGMWRFRAFTSQNMTGEDFTESTDVTATDLRARLYFTTIFHENLKFVTKFEMDTAFGSAADKGVGNWGDIGADGVNLEVKNAYVDFNLGPINAKVGAQYATLSHGFLFADDFSGIIATVNAGPFALPLIWIKAYEGGVGKDRNDYDVDYFGISPIINAGPVKINPFFLYAYTEQLSGISTTAPNPDYDKDKADVDTNIDPTYQVWPDNTPTTTTTSPAWKAIGANEMNLWYAGLNIDAKFDAATIWLTGIYQGGDIDVGPVQDFKAWLAAAGLTVNLPFGDIHGQGFYATGDDTVDNDRETFWVPQGQSYYWAEIMGIGDLRDTYYYTSNFASNNAPGDQIGNIMAGNLGVTIKPMDKLKITLDAWYAALAKDIVTLKGNQEKYLGTEVDLKITIQLVQGLNLDIVGAYLFAGEATTMEDVNEADPYEIGTRLSLSF